MLCPTCGRQLQEIQTESFVYHICKDSCGGILFIGSETEKFFTQTENVIKKIICVKSKTSSFYQNKLCPECCKKQMTTHYRNGIEVSNCPNCKNLWLDLNELNKIRGKYNIENDVVDETVDENLNIKETVVLPTIPAKETLAPDYETVYKEEKESTIAEKIHVTETVPITIDLLCPACGHQLQEIQADNFKYNICRDGCGGILIDHLEADKFIEQAENITDRILNVKSNNSIMYVSSVKRYCPKCDKQKMIPAKKNGIEISECPACKNIWLDSNEINRIREMHNSENITIKNYVAKKSDDILCPMCGQKLYDANANGFVYRICRDGCGGILIDNTDLKDMLGSSEFINKLLNTKLYKIKKDQTSKTRICPKCENQKMVKQLRHDVEFDECYRCGNIWFDYGEINKIYENNIAAKFHKKDDLRERSKEKKKSTLAKEYRSKKLKLSP